MKAAAGSDPILIVPGVPGAREGRGEYASTNHAKLFMKVLHFFWKTLTGLRTIFFFVIK